MPRVLIAGYYGYGNAGDEAVLAAIVSSLRSRQQDLDIWVLTADPEATERLFNVRPVPRLDLRAMFRAVAASDLVLIGGGSLLQDVTSRRNLVYYLVFVAGFAHLLGKPAMLFANGIGPVRTLLGRLLVPLLANPLDLITVRDRTSLAEARRLGVIRPRIELSADPALLLPVPSLDAGNRLLEQAGVQPGTGPLVGISTRPWKGSEAAGLTIARAVDRFCRRYGARAVFLPMQYPGDVEASRQVAAAMETDPILPEGRLEAAELFSLVAAMDLVVGVRFHALVFAARAGVPMVGLSYDPKVDGFLGSLGLAPAASIADVTEEGLYRALEESWSRREGFAAQVVALLGEQQQLATRSPELALELLGSRRGAVHSGDRAAEHSGGRVAVLGVGFDPLTLAGAASRIESFIEEGKPRMVVTPNPEIVYAAQSDAELRRILLQADLVAADGTGIVWAARHLGRPVPERVTGIELGAEVIARAAKRGYRLYLLGAAPGVAEEAGQRLVAQYPGLNLVGTQHGYFRPEEEPGVLEAIRRARPDLLLVGLGSPKQEKWIAAHQTSLGVPAAVGLGGCFDVWAGRTQRAPLIFQRLHLEWLYRLGREPRRFWRMLALPKFVLAVRRYGSKPMPAAASRDARS